MDDLEDFSIVLNIVGFILNTWGACELMRRGFVGLKEFKFISLDKSVTPKTTSTSGVDIKANKNDSDDLALKINEEIRNVNKENQTRNIQSWWWLALVVFGSFLQLASSLIH